MCFYCSQTKCCREQCKTRKFLLEHDDVSDFYLSACQASGGSALALLCVRAILFALCAMIMVSSIILTSVHKGFKFWFIYLTRWGLIGLTLTTGTSVVISCIGYFKGSIESNTGLPWYVKCYWALFNISVSLSFFITIYYHAFLVILGIQFAENNFLDFCVHGANSLIMLVHLMSSRHPVHILHFYWPLLISILYTIFSVIYYHSGGKDPYGHSYIYPILDWETPDDTAVPLMICFTAVVIIHLFVFALASLRDCVTRGCRRDRDTGLEPNAV